MKDIMAMQPNGSLITQEETAQIIYEKECIITILKRQLRQKDKDVSTLGQKLRDAQKTIAELESEKHGSAT